MSGKATYRTVVSRDTAKTARLVRASTRQGFIVELMSFSISARRSASPREATGAPGSMLQQALGVYTLISAVKRQDRQTTLDIAHICAYTHCMDDIAAIATRMKQECPAMRVRQAGRMLARHYDEAFRDLGLELSQLPVLAAIGARGDQGMTVGALATALVMDRT